MRTFFALIAILSFVGVRDAVAKPHCQPCPYSCYGLGLRKEDCKEIEKLGTQCCVELTRRGFRQVVQQEQVPRYPGDARPLQVAPPKPAQCAGGIDRNSKECAVPKVNQIVR